MILGDVEFIRVGPHLQHLASFVAFAASVRGYQSKLDAIESIGKKLGKFSGATPASSQFSVPLLGAGAGGLDPASVVSSLTRGFSKKASQYAKLTIFIRNEALYDRVTNSSAVTVTHRPKSAIDVNVPSNLRVFVSYTKTEPSHTTWVKSLATFLRENGIDARLDSWHLSHGSDVAQWMCNEIELADRVLLVCNEEYAGRADRRHGGVGWETRLIQGYILQEGERNPDKFIPIVRTPVHEAGLPAYLRTTFFIHWPPSRARKQEMQKEQEILKALYRAQEQAPAIGRRPAFVVGQMS
jgi:hypothetical protein